MRRLLRYFVASGGDVFPFGPDVNGKHRSYALSTVDPKLNPPPGDWRFIVATQDGRTIDILRLQVVRGTPAANEVLVREID